MELITAYAQCIDLRQGDTVRKILESETLDFQVHTNNNLGSKVDLLILPLLTPDVALVNGQLITDGTVSGGFPINTSYEDLMSGNWYKV